MHPLRISRVKIKYLRVHLNGCENYFIKLNILPIYLCPS